MVDLIRYLVIPIFPFIFFIIFLHKRRPAAPRLPPSPRKLPLIGNLHQLGLLPHRTFQSLSRLYGHLMLLHLGRVPVLVASSADAACEIMKNQDLIFSNRPKLIIPDRLIYGSKDVAFAPYGEYWRQARSICVLQLLSNKRVHSFRRVREEETSLMIEKIRELGSLLSVVNLKDVFLQVANDVVCRVALGRKYGDGGDGGKFKKLVGEYMDLLGTWNVGDYIPWLAWTTHVVGLDVRVERVAKMLEEFLEGVVREHRGTESREKIRSDSDDDDLDAELDFVDILLEVQREKRGGSSFEDDAVKALILVKFFEHNCKLNPRNYVQCSKNIL